MALFRFYLLSAVICSVLVVGHALPEAPTTLRTQTIDLKKLETTVPDTTLAPETTTEPDTTVPPTTTSSTTVPPTTTSSTTVPPTTTSTTTVPPTTTSSTTTTTQAPPSPTPKPVPGPPEMGTWSYTAGNVTCIVVQFAAQLNVTYPMANVSTLGSKFVNVPANATAPTGWCGATNQSLTITWPATADANNTIGILFEKNQTTKSYELKNIIVTLVPAMFPNITKMDAIVLYHGVEWHTPLATSYRCAAPTTLALTAAKPSESSVGAMMTLSQLQEEAFRSGSATTGFSAARDCAGGDIPDAVPIAVGCALGGMVVVVLIAYLVARRRSAARGYLSM